MTQEYPSATVYAGARPVPDLSPITMSASRTPSPQGESPLLSACNPQELSHHSITNNVTTPHVTNAKHTPPPNHPPPLPLHSLLHRLQRLPPPDLALPPPPLPRSTLQDPARIRDVTGPFCKRIRHLFCSIFLPPPCPTIRISGGISMGANSAIGTHEFVPRIPTVPYR